MVVSCAMHAAHRHTVVRQRNLWTLAATWLPVLCHASCGLPVGYHSRGLHQPEVFARSACAGVWSPQSLHMHVKGLTGASLAASTHEEPPSAN